MSRQTQHRFCAILIALNLAFIWGNSAMPGDNSGALSGWLLELLSFLPDSDLAHTILRKLAHFSEFGLLGILVCWLWNLHRDNLPVSLPGFGLAVACIDETIQYFVPGRASSLIDVWIDTAGFTTGLILLSFGYYIVKKRKFGGNQT